MFTFVWLKKEESVPLNQDAEIDHIYIHEGSTFASAFLKEPTHQNAMIWSVPMLIVKELELMYKLDKESAIEITKLQGTIETLTKVNSDVMEENASLKKDIFRTSPTKPNLLIELLDSGCKPDDIIRMKKEGLI
jgi:hypothetical protein